MSALGLPQQTSLMVDTGAALNLVKKRNVRPETLIDTQETLFLSGITKEKIKTLGSIDIKFMGYPITFHVVPNNFPIAQEGILGFDFLRDVTKIDYQEKCIHWQGIPIPFALQDTIVVPRRSSATLCLRVINTEISEGYIPRLSVGKGIYLGDSIVTNRDGKVCTRIINTNDFDFQFSTPTIELQEIEKISNHPSDEFDSNCGNKEMVVNNIQSMPCLTIQTKEHGRVQTIRELLRLDHLNKEESEHVDMFIRKHNDLFRLPDDKLACTTTVAHKITTTDDSPINIKQYRFPPIHKDEINKQVKDLLNNDTIKPSDSPYNSPLWIVPKKPDSKGNKRWRMVIDYRMLNEKTVGDAYPLPNITDILDQLGSAKYFSVFDLASGFHQIPMDRIDAPKTAFSTPYGHYEFNRMPFGLKNAPATFQRLMDQILSGLQGIELFVYLDDIVIYASSLEEHKIKFNKLAGRLRQANLRLQPDKCEFLRREVNYLGHIISEEGVKPDPKKIIAVQEFPTPQNAKNIKQFLGLAGYYRKFIPEFSKTAKPLTELLKKDIKFVWADQQKNAFTHLKNSLCSEPLLQYPDFTKPFIVTTDASGYAIGGILSQGIIGKDLPIAYTSRLLNNAEINYSTIEKELLAIVYCVNHFRPYLYGYKFSLVTDHKPLVWLHSVKDPTSRLVRWRLKLAEYEYEVIYKAGKTNINADALSRNPITIPSSFVNKPQAFPVLPLFTDTESNDPRSSPHIFQDETIYDSDNDEIEIPEIQEVNNNQETIDEYESSDDDSSGDETDGNTETENLNQNNNIQEIRDNFLSRNDDLVIFITQKGEPCDKGAHMLAEINKLPPITESALARARVINHANKNLIALVIKERISSLTEIEIIEESLHSLLDVTTELDLKTISICKGEVANVAWSVIATLLRRTFSDSNTKILICTNEISLPSERERLKIIEENHSSIIGGHKGVTKTYNRIRQRYFWPYMKQTVQNFIRNCKNCQLKKLVRVKTKQPMILTDTPDVAFDKISMDIMGPLPTSRSGSTHILTIQDLLTKYCLAIPLKITTATHVAEAFIKDFICTFGAPRALLTDQGTNFINVLMRIVAQKFKIKQYKTTAYRPQANGSVERSHHVLWEYLKQFVTRNDWDEYLKFACFSYNTSVHEGTKYTPYELVFGRIARVPSSDPPIEDIRNESYTNYLTELFYRLHEAQTNARKNLIVSKERSKTYYDKKINPHRFKIGDKVYLLKEPNKSKLGDQYTGPHDILQILDNNNIKIAIGTNKTRLVHADKIRIAKGDTPH